MSSIFLVLIAVVLICAELSVISWHTANIIWPILLALIGLQKVFGNRCKCCSGCRCGCCGDSNQISSKC